jgi:hypothetical protein
MVACNEVPIAALEKSFSMAVAVDTGSETKIQIDFLWVIDNTPSMCEEQVGLSSSFHAFTETLNQIRQVDPRVAVVTIDMQCDPKKTYGRSMGLFNQVPATAFPVPCQRKEQVKCLTDADCATALKDPGPWTCDAGSGITNQAKCLQNPNCTLNSTCKRRCLEDKDCKDYYNDSRFICQKPSTSEEDFGCLLPPDTKNCPETLPPFLTAENLDLFPCMATVGVNQEKCLKYEQGLKSAWAALDPNGPNAEQAKSFLRDEAYLVIIFVTDEDDCSTIPNPGDRIENYDKGRCAIGASANLMKIPPCQSNLWPEGVQAACGDLENPEYNECLWNNAAYLDASDATDGGLLEPASHYANWFKGLKSDPSKVVVAAIAGDSMGDSAGEVQEDRWKYVLSKGNRFHCFAETHICASSAGKADWGSRYQAVVDGVGSNGVFTNLCSAEEGTAALAPALAQIANLIIQVVNKLCLPKPLADGTTLKVVRTDLNGVATTLKLGDGPGTFSIIDGGDECKVDGVAMRALKFFEPPVRGEAIYVEYQAKPLLD